MKSIVNVDKEIYDYQSVQRLFRRNFAPDELACFERFNWSSRHRWRRQRFPGRCFRGSQSGRTKLKINAWNWRDHFLNQKSIESDGWKRTRIVQRNQKQMKLIESAIKSTSEVWKSNQGLADRVAQVKDASVKIEEIQGQVMTSLEGISSSTEENAAGT